MRSLIRYEGLLSERTLSSISRRLIAASLLAGYVALPTVSAFAGDAAEAAEVAGYLYTSLNGEGTNQVISLERHKDGTLGAQLAYPTGSLGGANRAAGGDAAGDFDSQGAIQVIDDKLLVVNAGGSTISVFTVDRTNGSLSERRNVSSNGTRPVTMASVPKRSTDDEYWVVVGNQWNNPNVQKGGEGEGPIELYPNAEFHAAGGGHEEVVAERNISLFSFNSATGVLSLERSLDSYSGTNGGPTTVEFNNDGTKLAVATWGIAHFGTETPTHQQPSRVYVYDFDGASGTVTNSRHFEEEGIAGSIGFTWDTKTSNLYVSNFNLVPEKRDHSLTVLRDNGREVVKVANFGTGNGSDIDEACWVILNAEGNKLYVSSFGGNLLSVFDVAVDGEVSKIGHRSETTFELRKPGTPPGDTKDMYISDDGQYLYALGAYQTFTVSSFNIGRRGTLSLQDEYSVDAATERGAGAYNFLGLAGIDKR